MPADKINPKFNIEDTYTKEEFIFLASALAAPLQDSDPLKAVLDNFVKRAEDIQEKDILVSWEIGSDGYARPVFSVSTPTAPNEPPQPKVYLQ